MNQIVFHWSLAALLLALLRLLPAALFLRGACSGDMLAHRFFINRERARPGSMWRTGDNYLFLFHSLAALSHLPVRLLHLALPFLSDLAVLSGMALFLWHLQEQDITLAKHAWVVLYGFAIYHAFLVLHAGPRSYGLNERVVAEAAFSLAMLLLAAQVLPWMLGAVLLIAYLMLSSRFALQALLLLLAPALALAQAWWALAALAAGMMLPFLIPSARYAERLRMHVDHVRYYLRLVNDPRYWIGRRNRLPRCQKGLSIWRCLQHWARFLMRTNGLSAGLVWHWPVLLAAGLFLLHGTTGHRQVDILGWLTVMAVPLWLLTSIGTMKILGESERYLNYAVVAALILLAAILPVMPLPLVLAYGAAGIVFWVYGMMQLKALARRHRQQRKALRELCAWMDAQPSDARFALLLPTHDLWVLLEKYGPRVSWHDLFLKDAWTRHMDAYPHPTAEYVLKGGYDFLIASAASNGDVADILRQLPVRRLHALDGYVIYTLSVSAEKSAAQPDAATTRRDSVPA